MNNFPSLIIYLLGEFILQKEIRNRVLQEAEYLLKTKQTIREIADQFQISKSTVHKDLSERLEEIRKDLYDNVQKILIKHTEERHIRGGESTKKRFQQLK